MRKTGRSYDEQERRCSRTRDEEREGLEEKGGTTKSTQKGSDDLSEDGEVVKEREVEEENDADDGVKFEGEHG